MTDQSTDTPKVQLDEPIRLLGLLTGTEMTQTTVLTKTHPIMGDSSSKLETWSIFYSLQQLNRLQSVLSR